MLRLRLRLRLLKLLLFIFAVEHEPVDLVVGVRGEEGVVGLVVDPPGAGDSLKHIDPQRHHIALLLGLWVAAYNSSHHRVFACYQGISLIAVTVVCLGLVILLLSYV